MVNLGIPCEDPLKVMTYVDNMYRSGIFKQVELMLWENTPSLQTWDETRIYFDKLWVDRSEISAREEDARPFESAVSVVDSRCPFPDRRRLTVSQQHDVLLLLDQLEVEKGGYQIRDRRHNSGHNNRNLTAHRRHGASRRNNCHRHHNKQQRRVDHCTQGVERGTDGPHQ